MLITPVAARAQTVADVLAVQIAIRAELARPGSGITPADIAVNNVQFEGAFATAGIAGSNFMSPIVFAKLAQSKWMVVFVGTETTPADCRHIGFTAGSQMCPN